MNTDTAHDRNLTELLLALEKERRRHVAAKRDLHTLHRLRGEAITRRAWEAKQRLHSCHEPSDEIDDLSSEVDDLLRLRPEAYDQV